MPQWLRDDEFVSSRLLRLTDVPHHKPAVAAQQLDAADAARPGEQPLDLGKLKQKCVDYRWGVSFHSPGLGLGGLIQVRERRLRDQMAAKRKGVAATLTAVAAKPQGRSCGETKCRSFAVAAKPKGRSCHRRCHDN